MSTRSPRTAPKSLFRLERKPVRTKRAPSELRYTFMVVPDGAKGRTWQASLSLRAVRGLLAGAIGAATLLFALVGVQAATYRRVVAHDALVSENLALRARLDQVDNQLEEVSALIQRVRVYDDQLRQMGAKGTLPGFGPIDAEEAAAREAWLAAVVPLPPGMGAAAERDPELRSAELEARTADLVAEMRALEPSLDAIDANLAVVEAMEDVLPVMWPVDEASLTSPFGWRRSPFGRRWKFHSGIDLGAPSGEPIYATNGGLVSFAGWHYGHGRMVDVDHGNGVVTRYAHASRLLVEAGDAVEAGDPIALVGSTGMSTGPHLHYEIFFDGEQVDPLDYLP